MHLYMHTHAHKHIHSSFRVTRARPSLLGWAFGLKISRASSFSSSSSSEKNTVTFLCRRGSLSKYRRSKISVMQIWFALASARCGLFGLAYFVEVFVDVFEVTLVFPAPAHLLLAQMRADINYRTHNGILAAAAGIVDVLEHFFGNTIDAMPRERGFFEGHRPILLSGTAEHDAAVMILGSDRKHSQIEFGAHQVLLMRNQASKHRLPSFFDGILATTVLEAKGLEFDDVSPVPPSLSPIHTCPFSLCKGESPPF